MKAKYLVLRLILNIDHLFPILETKKHQIASTFPFILCQHNAAEPIIGCKDRKVRKESSEEEEGGPTHKGEKQTW